jgi:hypothetical protein
MPQRIELCEALVMAIVAEMQTLSFQEQLRFEMDDGKPHIHVNYHRTPGSDEIERLLTLFLRQQ